MVLILYFLCSIFGMNGVHHLSTAVNRFYPRWDCKDPFYLSGVPSRYRISISAAISDLDSSLFVPVGCLDSRRVARELQSEEKAYIPALLESADFVNARKVYNVADLMIHRIEYRNDSVSLSLVKSEFTGDEDTILRFPLDGDIHHWKIKSLKGYLKISTPQMEGTQLFPIDSFSRILEPLDGIPRGNGAVSTFPGDSTINWFSPGKYKVSSDFSVCVGMNCVSLLDIPDLFQVLVYRRKKGEKHLIDSLEYFLSRHQLKKPKATSLHSLRNLVTSPIVSLAFDSDENSNDSLLFTLFRQVAPYYSGDSVCMDFGLMYFEVKEFQAKKEHHPFHFCRIKGRERYVFPRADVELDIRISRKIKAGIFH